MNRSHRAAPRASLLVAVVLAACALAGADIRAARAADAAAGANDVVTKQASSFAIYSGDHRLGTETFRIYAIADTVIMTSDVWLDGASPESSLPLTKSAAFRQRAFDSYPVAFAAEWRTRRDTTRTDRVTVQFQFGDTACLITNDRADRGRVESVALPPGRLYILEPGVYLQVQVLLADFLARPQDERKQGVLIPSLAQVIDLDLKRGPAEDIIVRGRRVHTTRASMTDGTTAFDAWLDADGRMWRLVAAGQPLHIERGRDEAPPAAKAKGAAGKTAPSHHATAKPAKNR